jgi:predicted secreted protein
VAATSLLSRRRWLALSAAGGAGVLAGGACLAARAGTRGAVAPGAGGPVIQLGLPEVTTNGAKVPVVVEALHPMVPSDFVQEIQVVNPRDPIPLKGVFRFTPASGQAYVAFQTRLHEGLSTVHARAQCTRHGPAAAERTVRVAEGGGGCAVGRDPARPGLEEVRPPVIRIPRLAGGAGIAPGDVVDVQVKLKHPGRTGLRWQDGAFVQVEEPFFVRELVVFYPDHEVARCVFTAAVSDHPLVTFRLRADREALVRVVVTNNRGQRWEAAHPMRWA